MKIGFIFITYILVIPGIAFLNVYIGTDPRFAATQWMYKNIPNDSTILSEAANVIDLPSPDTLTQIPNIVYQNASFDFYTVDENSLLIPQLQGLVSNSQYLFVPSRRVFKNHTCEEENKSVFNLDLNYKARCEYFQTKYPVLNEYYKKLFSGKLGFQKIAEFSNYPKIQLFGKTLIEFPDENAEETWTVFDHPVIRIYKKI